MFRERPLFLPLLSMAAGLTASHLTGGVLPSSWLIATLFCLLLSSGITGRIPFISALILFFFCWGGHVLTPYLSPVFSSDDVSRLASRDIRILEGLVVSRPQSAPEGGNLVLRVDSLVRRESTERIRGRLLLYVSEGDIPWVRGDRIRLASAISLPHRLGIPGERDYQRRLAYQSVFATVRVKSADDVVLIRGGAEEGLLRDMDLMAHRLAGYIRHVLPDTAVHSVLSALLLGDQKRIPEDLAAAYTRAGVNHILSISGFHVGIIAFFIVQSALLVALWSESLALYCNLRRAVMLLALPAMTAYLLLTGCAPATARSVIMLAVFVIALYVERESDPVNTLLLAAFLLLALDPPSLFDVSFQLSFLALWGMTVFIPPLMSLTGSFNREWSRLLIQFVSVSVAASLATVVPVLYYFHQASLNGILSNFLIVPLLGYGAVIAGFSSLPLIVLFPGAANLLLWGAGYLVRISNWLITGFAKLPQVTFHGISELDMFFMLMIMIAITFLPKSRLRMSCCVVPAILAFAFHLGTATGDNRLHLNLLSVGQGESLLVRFPHGAAMLVDGGGYLHDTGRDFGERVLAPALWKMGVRSLDHIVLTHTHPDHLGGLPFVMAHFPVGELWVTGRGAEGAQYALLMDQVKRRDIPVRRVAAGSTPLVIDGVSIEVLSPTPQFLPGRTETDDAGLNETSLVIRLRYGDFTVLLTADAGFDAENELMGKGVDLQATVLKIGHHGSRYSTSDAFLDRVRPRLALISAGSGNNFGLPAMDTINQLNQKRIPVWRTDQDGTIEVVSDGKTWNVTSMLRSSQ